jgi:alpha/beta superfamily hydrolase
LDWLERQFHLPIVFAGFSFGASVGLHVCCSDPRAVALISLGTPVAAEGRTYQYRFLADCAKPKLFVSGDRDEFGPMPVLTEIVGRAHPPRKLVFVEGAGHFFENKLGELKRVIENWVRETRPDWTVAPPL